MILSDAELLLLYGFAHFYIDIAMQSCLQAPALVFLSGYSAFAGIAVLILVLCTKTHKATTT